MSYEAAAAAAPVVDFRTDAGATNGLLPVRIGDGGGGVLSVDLQYGFIVKTENFTFPDFSTIFRHQETGVSRRGIDPPRPCR